MSLANIKSETPIAYFCNARVPISDVNPGHLIVRVASHINLGEKLEAL